MQANPGLLLVLALCPLGVYAEEPEPPPPSLALLEYLGEWQDEAGNAIDPQALALLQLDSTQGGGKSDDEE